MAGALPALSGALHRCKREGVTRGNSRRKVGEPGGADERGEQIVSETLGGSSCLV